MSDTERIARAAEEMTLRSDYEDGSTRKETLETEIHKLKTAKKNVDETRLYVQQQWYSINQEPMWLGELWSGWTREEHDKARDVLESDLVGDLLDKLKNLSEVLENDINMRDRELRDLVGWLEWIWIKITGF